jgi:site-specific DNA recombinase
MTKLKRVTKKQVQQAQRTVARRVIGYVRVSPRPTETGLSIEAQTSQIRTYAKLYNLELVELIVDDRESAKTIERPGLARAFALIDAGEADGILVAKLDRLTRSVRDLGDLLDRRFRRAALLSVAEQVDTSNPSGRLVLNVLVSVAQWEREAISERTAAALAAKAARGERTTGIAPYGWRHVDGRVVESAEEQVTLHRARELRSSGLSVRAIGAQLAREGRLGRTGEAFSHTQVHRMLGRVVEVPAGE